MKKIMVFAAAALLLAASCKVMKKLPVVKVPQNVKEQKQAEKNAENTYKNGRYRQSVAILRALIKKDPKNPKYWSRLGSAYAQLNMFSYSEYAFKKAIQYNPKNIKAMYNLSVVYSEKGRRKHAMKMIQRALKIDPKNPLLQASLGNVLIDEEKYKPAKKVYERIVKVKPDFDIGHYNLGVINYQERKLDEAEKNYKDVLRIDSNDHEARQNLAAIEILKHDYENAVTHLKQVIRSNPGSDITLENAYFNLGVAYLRMKKFKDALSAFEMALKIEPWDMSAYVNAAIICEELGYKDKAIRYWKKYDRLLPINKRKKEIARRLKKMGVNYKPEPTPSPKPEKKEEKKEKKKGFLNWGK